MLAGGTRKIQRVIGTNSWIGLLASIVLGSQLLISQSLHFVIIVYPLQIISIVIQEITAILSRTSRVETP